MIADNTLEDSVRGGVLDVVHGPAEKSNQGRVYLSATMNDNTAVWSDAFLAQLAKGGPKAVPLALTVGDPLSADPAELLLTALGNQVEPPPNIVPGKTLQVNAGVVNGQVMVNQGVALPTVPVLTATALGQDGVDLVGNGLSSAHPDGAQDVDILLAGLPASQAVRYIDVMGAGGGEWQFNAQNGPRPHGSDAAALVRGAGSTSAHLYVQPYMNETGRNYQVTIFYDNGSSVMTYTSPVFAKSKLPVRASTTTSLSLSSSTAVYGQSVTFTATVSPVAPGSGTPTGTVTSTTDRRPWERPASPRERRPSRPPSLRRASTRSPRFTTATRPLLRAPRRPSTRR